jgi:uncharacterized membrane protein YphA (DoxX/SURF4 family)
MATTTRRFGAVLWTVQVLLALLFIWAGAMKLIMPIELLTSGPVSLPGAFLRFIGMAELLGGLGLVLPGALRIARGATPLAALGLVTIMTGATAITVQGGAIAPAVIPGVIAALTAAVALGRREWAGRLAGV